MNYDIREITDDIRSWLESVYPDRHPDKVWEKLQEELEELKERPTDAWEWADVLILVLDLMDIYGIDPAKAIHWKMDRNRKRQWEFKDGKLVHVQSDAPSALQDWGRQQMADSQDTTASNISGTFVHSGHADSFLSGRDWVTGVEPLPGVTLRPAPRSSGDNNR